MVWMGYAAEAFHDAVIGVTLTMDHASTSIEEVAAALKAKGWHVEREVPVLLANRRTKRGRIDIVAVHDEYGCVAAEFDRRSPRQKSAAKLRNYWKADARVILLRGKPKDIDMKSAIPDGIDALIFVDIRDAELRSWTAEHPK